MPFTKIYSDIYKKKKSLNPIDKSLCVEKVALSGPNWYTISNVGTATRFWKRLVRKAGEDPDGGSGLTAGTGAEKRNGRSDDVTNPKRSPNTCGLSTTRFRQRVVASHT